VIEQITLQDDTRVSLRPIRPDDAPRLQEAFSRLSPQTIYMRFLQAAKGLSDAQARTLAEVDYRTRMAIVGTIPEEGQERIIAVARYGILEPEEERVAEAAVVVRDDYQQRGLGKIVMHRLARYAQKQGIRAFAAVVHASNIRVLKFIQHSGLPYEKKVLEPGAWIIHILLEPPTNPEA
jgi:RimJ/RimL family protein N-acetyltransferase